MECRASTSLTRRCLADTVWDRVGIACGAYVFATYRCRLSKIRETKAPPDFNPVKFRAQQVDLPFGRSVINGRLSVQSAHD